MSSEKSNQSGITLKTEHLKLETFPMHLPIIIARGLEITAQIDRLKAELKSLESILESAALDAEHIPLEDADREGRQALLGGDNIVLPVIFESDLVAASIPDIGPQIGAIRQAIGDDALVARIWRPSGKLERSAKDGQAYRKQLRSLLSPTAAAAVLQASIQRDKTGIPKSRTIIAWDRAKPIV